MKLRLSLAVLFALVAFSPALATTKGAASAITGAVNPATTELGIFVSPNQIFEIIAVLPVVSTVTGTPASMAASVNIQGTPFALCGSNSGPECNGEMWAGQWTIVSSPAGIQAVSAYQGTSIRLVNTSPSLINVLLHCRVGLMTGSCIFVFREQLTSDPLF